MKKTNIIFNILCLLSAFVLCACGNNSSVSTPGNTVTSGSSTTGATAESSDTEEPTASAIDDTEETMDNISLETSSSDISLSEITLEDDLTTMETTTEGHIWVTHDYTDIDGELDESRGTYYVTRFTGGTYTNSYVANGELTADVMYDLKDNHIRLNLFEGEKLAKPGFYDDIVVKITDEKGVTHNVDVYADGAGNIVDWGIVFMWTLTHHEYVNVSITVQPQNTSSISIYNFKIICDGIPNHV